MLTDKEKMELLNLRKRIVSQREEIRRLREFIERIKKDNPGLILDSNDFK